MIYELRDARSRLRLAQNRYFDAIKNAYPPGCSIYYEYGDSYRGPVEVVSAHGDRLRVKNTATDKTYWIYEGPRVRKA